MMKRLALFLVIAFSSALTMAGEGDLGATSSLKVDLDAVVKLGEVTPVSGITTAGQPTEEGFKVFADNGYVAVIDLRTPGEDRGLDEPAVVEGLGMEYVNFPIGRDGVTFANAEALGELLDKYEEPVLVHCGSANRVGALFAIKAFSDTGDIDEALEVGRAAGLTRMEPKVKEVIGDE